MLIQTYSPYTSTAGLQTKRTKRPTLENPLCFRITRTDRCPATGHFGPVDRAGSKQTNWTENGVFVHTLKIEAISILKIDLKRELSCSNVTGCFMALLLHVIFSHLFSIYCQKCCNNLQPVCTEIPFHKRQEGKSSLPFIFSFNLSSPSVTSGKCAELRESFAFLNDPISSYSKQHEAWKTFQFRQSTEQCKQFHNPFLRVLEADWIIKLIQLKVVIP